MVRAVVAVALVIAMTSMAGAQVRDVPDDEILGSMSRAGSSGILRGRSDGVTHIVAWTAAVWSHHPGETDDAAREIAAWTPAALADLEIELITLHALIRNIRLNVFQIPRAPGDTVPRQVVYAAEELKTLRDLVVSIQHDGGEAALLGRAAVLHTDIALGIVRPPPLPPVRERSSASAAAATIGARRRTVEFADGRQRESWQLGDHWRTARLLLDLLMRVVPTASGDVRAWYRATIASTQQEEQWEIANVEHALRRFRDDPDLLFLAGCLHEALTSSRLRSFLERADLPSDFTWGVRSPGDEYRIALDFLKRSLDRRPGAETRLHYGRLLLLDRRPADAVKELTTAAREVEQPPLTYYANLFLGSAFEELGRAADARAAYTRAADLFPDAQSPRLALSALAMRAGDRGGASDALETLIASEKRDAERDDPWWRYHTSQARDAHVWLDDVRQRLASPPAAGR